MHLLQSSIICWKKAIPSSLSLIEQWSIAFFENDLEVYVSLMFTSLVL